MLPKSSDLLRNANRNSEGVCGVWHQDAGADLLGQLGCGLWSP